MNLLRRLLPKPALPPALAPVAAAARGEDTAAAEYAEFCETFYAKPRVRFMDMVRRHHVQPLGNWLRPETPDAEPKAIIRMMLELTRAGTPVWTIPGLSIYLKGRWDAGGGPSQTSQDSISQFAQIIGKPVKVFYKPSEDAPEQVLEFSP